MLSASPKSVSSVSRSLIKSCLPRFLRISEGASTRLSLFLKSTGSMSVTMSALNLCASLINSFLIDSSVRSSTLLRTSRTISKSGSSGFLNP